MNPGLKKAAPLILVAVLGLLLFLIRQCQHQTPSKQGSTVNSKEAKKSTTDAINRERGFDRRIAYLEYSNHAKCRMQCRSISQAEVEQVMTRGRINYNKSDLKNARCPRYTLEGITSDDQKVRIVFAQCNDKTVVVTVIDISTEWSCDCPGDDKKYDNKN